MKNSLLLLVSLWATTVFAQNPVYLDANGVTIKAREWAKVGDKGVFDGVTYIVVDDESLRQSVEEGWDMKTVCTSHVTDMEGMFHKSQFNGDISNWDVSNVTKMTRMFAVTPFNGDISKWDVSNVTDMEGMFAHSPFNGDISNWDVSNVVNCDLFSQDATHNFPKPNFTNCD
jgi:surface protein